MPVLWTTSRVLACCHLSGDCRPNCSSMVRIFIVATAVANRLPVHTCHAADFEGIDGLDVVPVALPRQASS